MRVAVTGAAGYIGGQCALLLQDQGHEVIGLDRRALPAHLADCMQFVQADFDSDLGRSTLASGAISAIIHCAGTSLVGPSMSQPSDYYNNNTAKTLRLLDFVTANLPGCRIIFSSSAAVYGNPQQIPCSETDATDPISPYGQSKLMIEKIMADYHRAYGLDYVAFRYFNACGADPQGRHGQESGATHIIARVLESIKQQRQFVLYGTDYDTADGSCVRDYVHVDDIARAHVSALTKSVTAGVYNLGSNSGTSNLEIVAAAERITGHRVDLYQGQRRAGDPDTLIASAAKFDAVCAGWRQHTLDSMIQTAWRWYVR